MSEPSAQGKNLGDLKHTMCKNLGYNACCQTNAGVF